VVLGDDVARRRRLRLREELDDAGVRLDLGRPTSRQTLDEITYARFPRRHEGKLPTYGAFVVSDDVDVRALGGVVVEGDGVTLDTLRMMADGRRSFVVAGRRRRGLVMFPTAFDREAEIAHLLDDKRDGDGLVVVQRLTDGVVRILGLDGLVIWDGARWRNKPYASAFVEDVLCAVPGCPRPVLEAILAFCVHDLGPAPTGAIVVWDLRDRDRTDRLGHVRHRQPVLRLPPTSLLDPTSHSAVRSLLGQLDGAVLVDRDATPVEAGVRLTFSERAERSVTGDVDGGTRHASARRFSVDEPETVVFVVSEDGPLTVYARGDPIARLDTLHWGVPTHLDQDRLERHELVPDKEARDEHHDRHARTAAGS
jgi:DNA integrity scanning protein DisA with diadenylate cyclase activity